MPNKKLAKNKNSTNPVIEPIFNTTSFNDLTNIHLLLQQQQNQIIALTSSAIHNNYDISTATPIVVSGQVALTSPITSDAQIGANKLTNR
ncbi:hypothetical protein C1645_820343 [Glomus cerebriforme]|uniref:Uncharacterized protein n=1 Tax=Glomus cerebriforme TaxID=658196 RepID=A0A397TCJ4_9GLOM|nr:hypothetical protein C1645_820343 [Glomus cerebriforme]